MGAEDGILGGDKGRVMKLLKYSILPFFIFLTAFSSLAQEKRYEVPILDSPSTGPANAPVTIIEFLDYQ